MPDSRRSPGRYLTTTSLVLALAACAGAPDATSEDVAALGIDLTVDLDPASGAVVLPFDRLVPDFYENDILATGASAAVALCAAGSGVTFDPPPLSDDPVYASEHYFGPWTADQAARFAFVPPMSLRDMAANEIAGAPEPAGATEVAPGAGADDELTDDDWAVIDACNADDDVAALLDATIVTGPWTDAVEAVRDGLPDEDGARALIDELARCYAAEGLEPADDAPWLPEGTNGREITQAQIELAVSVVRCKDSVDFTRRMADIEAGLQAPIIRRYAHELAEQRGSVDEALDLAATLLSEASR